MLGPTIKRPVVVYLDQNHWVGLLRPHNKELMEILISAKEDGHAIFPLSATHYLETWHRSEWRSRHALASVMRELSDWATLAPIHKITELELRKALSEWFQLGDPEPIEVLGSGVSHAFDSSTGRFRAVESIRTLDSPEGPTVDPPEEFLRIASQRSNAWEWMNLAGPELDFPLSQLGETMIEYRPEHRRGDDWAEWENSVRQKVEDTDLSDRLRDALVLEDLLALREEISVAAHSLDIDVGYFARSFVGRGTEFHDLLPSRRVLVDLQCLRLEDANLPLRQHDRPDLMALSVALVYCDVVVTERFWRHLAHRAEIGSQFGTTVLDNLTLLPKAIEETIY